MATSASGDAPYCTVEQFLQRVDRRSVRQLLSDTGEPTSDGALEDSATLQALLKEASGEVEAAACAGQRYVIDSTRNDLAALTGNAAEFLAGMTARLAYHVLWLRRPNPSGGLPADVQRALDFLEQLRLGVRVFGILENHQAAALDADVETSAQVESRGGLSVAASRFFGVRVDRLNG